VGARQRWARELLELSTSVDQGACSEQVDHDDGGHHAAGCTAGWPTRPGRPLAPQAVPSWAPPPAGWTLVTNESDTDVLDPYRAAGVTIISVQDGRGLTGACCTAGLSRWPRAVSAVPGGRRPR
jgi:hypothetical protein